MDVSLNELGHKYGTGKVRVGYLPHYERLLAPLRHESFDLLEVGVREGASIRLWHEYFSAARIVGLDLRARTLTDDLPRYTFVQGSQADLALLHRLVQQYKFRLIIDDGSHLWGHQVFTFQTLFPWLEPGGLYICEDIHTSYGDYAERYHGGAKESAAAYFFRVAQVLAAGKAQAPLEDEDPLMHFIVEKIRSITFIPHCVVIAARGMGEEDKWRERGSRGRRAVGDRRRADGGTGEGEAGRAARRARRRAARPGPGDDAGQRDDDQGQAATFAAPPPALDHPAGTEVDGQTIR